jgi:hypothetical protein
MIPEVPTVTLLTKMLSNEKLFSYEISIFIDDFAYSVNLV